MDHSPSSSCQKPFISTTSHISAAALICRASANPNRASADALAIDLNNDEEEEHAAAESSLMEQEIPKERLFEKPLTPSDVGKLNRLVIPKQQAEKHFPLHGGAESGENGLLLGFEDELGRWWQFRYSYWNSSQSYVLTKGWNRFVKEKRLDAGDIVVFERHRVDAGRLFIGWRRRNSTGGGGTEFTAPFAWGRMRMLHQGHPNPIQQHPQSNSLHFRSEAIRAGLQKQTTSSGKSKTLRLFGVNLMCQADEPDPVGSPLHQYCSNNHMDINLSGADVYRQG